MSRPFYDEEDQDLDHSPPRDPSLTVWILSGAALIFIYIVALLLLRPL